MDLNIRNIKRSVRMMVAIVLLLLGGILLPRILTGNFYWPGHAIREKVQHKNNSDSMLIYGKDLVVHTAKYFGPNGEISAITNGMNCQNCHLNAGTKEYGNNYFAVAANYPKYRARSGKTESVRRRINDCFERSLNGKAIDTNSREMLALETYILSVGKTVPKRTTPKYAGIANLDFISRAADPVAGKLLFQKKCISCHGENGQGVKDGKGMEYTYPPLWGEHSFNSGAGLFRISRMAGFIRYNMPLGAGYKAPQIAEEEAWDIAAYIVSMPRPDADISKDWPYMEEKPVDHPFGPFADGLGEKRHKYGPFVGLKSKKH